VLAERRKIQRVCEILLILPYRTCSFTTFSSSSCQLKRTHATSLDPRIKRIKQEEKEAREAKKKGKGQSGPGKKTKAEEEEEKRRAEEAAKKKEEEDKVCSRFSCVILYPTTMLIGMLGCSSRSQKG
jgi:uncharacterized membrane protein YukC